MVKVACLVAFMSISVVVPEANGRELADAMAGPRLPMTGQPAVQSERFAGKGTSLFREVPPEGEDKPAELLASHTDKRSRTTVEIGALGGGRADAPSLVHVGLGWTF